MRRIPNAMAAMVGTFLGLLAPSASPLEAQDDLGVLVRPPAEIGSDPGIHPAPPAPALPMVSPGSTATGVPGPSLAIGPSSGLPTRRSVSSPTMVDRPAIGASAISVLPPVGLGPAGEGRPQGDPPVPGLTTIAPPILPEGDRDDSLNPLLPPAEGSRGRVSRPDPDRGVETRSDRDVRTEERRRPGLIRGLFDRLSGRPEPPDPTIVLSRPGRRQDDAIEPEDLDAIERLRREIEREILGREADRLASIEVLIVGNRVHLRAEAARPWQRRALRRGLESLPMPDGYRASVDVR